MKTLIDFHYAYDEAPMDIFRENFSTYVMLKAEWR